MADWSLSDAYTDQKADTIGLEIGPTLYEYLMKESDFAATIQNLRKSVLQERGVYLPAVRIKTGSAEEPNRYIIRIRGRRVADGDLYPPLRFSEQHVSDRPAIHPMKRIEGYWTENEGETAREIITAHLRHVLHSRVDELFTYELAVRWLKQAKSHVPELVDELKERGMTPGLLWSVVKILLRDRIPIHPFEELLENILDYYISHPPQGYAPPGWTHPHPESIAKFIAEKRKRRIPAKKDTGNVIGFVK
ncbi:MAG: FHIPEP family type III secretion protein [Planifilum fimeticola]|jgi:flagellar biosynthesis component FlhA